ncbi:TPA: hypothetical protein NH684_002288 [Pseudomonas aeruginosa]|uniref:hypothetical protein n=1 Tax=Pseudomonas aeruginosa TaxID=287 RepID=UPI00053E3569|nr:hypothetical protein [Pseudomonas aeruginosa]EMC2524061.1 hypothetical protein [Pseudomonas aeruginosa]MBA5208025.1 hypothetical protein [Pseudomonas aeruginosa]MBG4574075.1 hypothetical protein [Pseudomonas aeruginosa]MBM9966665.1 hypothetical protein [Pseudomonas aeruginosa]MBN0096853.1 hypothetical protein [Pseudomonas aeruginosa]
MITASSYITDAKALLAAFGVHQVTHGVWAFTDIQKASQGYIHHSQQPAALAAYAAVNPTFAAGRFPGYTLTSLVDKVPSMDYAEYAALSLVCGADIPSFEGWDARAFIFGQAAWQIVEKYELQGCFERQSVRDPVPGDHYNMRPRGYNWGGDHEAIPDALKSMRKCYRAMTPVQQVMTLTVMHLYRQGKDKFFLTGGCPTKIMAADALHVLREQGALPDWAHLVTHYAGW